MSDDRDEKLDRMLRSRRLESASPDLAQRIILQAQRLPQKKTFPLWQWLGELCVEFHLPKPAYVVATALILGLAIGFSVPSERTSAAGDNLSSAGARSVFSAGEALL
jgi:hypothetical protein